MITSFSSVAPNLRFSGVTVISPPLKSAVCTASAKVIFLSLALLITIFPLYIFLSVKSFAPSNMKVKSS